MNQKIGKDRVGLVWKRRQFYVALILLTLISAASLDAFACLNPAGSESVGTMIQIEKVSSTDFLKNLVTHEDSLYWEQTLKELKLEQKWPSWQNIAVAMIHLGQIKEAIQILEKIEKEEPGIYYTAANLGTAYELNGDNQKALKWIREGVIRNKDSHYATEWLHVKILEAKIALEKDPDWLQKHSVLGVDFELDNVSGQQVAAVDHLGQQRNLSQIESALVYQLHERLEFIKPKEAVVADLLFDLSRVFSLTRTQEHSDAVRDFALTYGSDHRPDAFKKKADKISSDDTSSSPNYLVYSGIIIGALGCLLGLYFIKRRMMK